LISDVVNPWIKLLHRLGPHDLSIVRDSYANCTFQHFSIFVLDISRFLSNLPKCGTTPTLMEKFVKYKEQCHGSKTTSSCKIRLSKPYSLIFIKIYSIKSQTMEELAVEQLLWQRLRSQPTRVWVPISHVLMVVSSTNKNLHVG
jgi:hypothetical protein